MPLFLPKCHFLWSGLQALDEISRIQARIEVEDGVSFLSSLARRFGHGGEKLKGFWSKKFFFLN